MTEALGVATRSQELAVADGEFAFTWSDFRQIAQLVHSEAGIVLAESKVHLVYSRLAKRLRAIGLRNFREYCALVTSADGADERQLMIAAMTTNVTRFFREPHHFEYLRDHIFPSLLGGARRGGRVRVWSAGCSSGEEAYSIGISILELLPEAAGLDVRILASDIDTEMLRRGSEGQYEKRQIEDVPAEMRRKWFVPVIGNKSVFEVSTELHSLVRFRELNLLNQWPMAGRFDIIFCRNVMIYFDDKTQNETWKRFSEVLVPGGLLCIGHSERISAASQPYDLIGQTIYRLRRGAQ
ncbi:MAG: protein-glutamate O-methyltransferase [Alphaproteobacteria bacterium]|nr:protein-glutamate O-methyltransferase [Alphaproteobacteria bacterium]